MRFARLPSLLLILFAALLAGCGGDRLAAEEVTVDPPTLTIPSDPEAAPGATTADADDENAEEDADGDEADATPTADPAAGGGTSSGATTPAPSGGSAATPAPTAEPTATAAPPEDTGGATADEGLDQFCADNPGAC